MRLIIALPLLAALSLSACNKNEKSKGADEVKDEMSRMVKPRPGLYRSTSRLVSFDVPGLPPAEAARLKQAFSTAEQGRNFCLTKEEAGKGQEQMLKKLAEGNCAYDRFDASGSRLDAKLTCQTGKDMKATIEMKGTISAEGSQMRMSVDQVAPGGKSVKMVAEVASQRVGDCPGA